MSKNLSAKQIVDAAIDAAGAAGGRDEVAAIAAKGIGDMQFEAADMAVLVEEYGTPNDAMHAVQAEAQRRISKSAV